jgi:hypothetical protein
VPAIARPGRDPRERGERARHRSPHHRRLPADRERIGEDHKNRDSLADQPAHAGDACCHDDADGDDRDVLPRHGEQVHEAARLERLTQLSIDFRVLAEHDPCE